MRIITGLMKNLTKLITKMVAPTKIAPPLNKTLPTNIVSPTEIAQLTKMTPRTKMTPPTKITTPTKSNLKKAIALATVAITALGLLLSGTIIPSKVQSANEPYKVLSANEPNNVLSANEPNNVLSANEPPKKITMKAMMMYDWYTKPTPDWEWGKDPVTRKITEKTGVTLEILSPAGKSEEKLNIMLNSGDYPEIILMDRDSGWYNYIEAGVLLPIDSLALQYGFRKITGNYLPKNVINSMVYTDGHLYGIPNWFNEKVEIEGNFSININTSIYKKLGSPVIGSLDAFTAYLRKIKATNLKIGEQKVYPLPPIYYFNDYGIFSGLWGLKTTESKYYDPKDKKIKFVGRSEKFKQALNWWNKAVLEGLVDIEMLTMNIDQAKQALSKGRWAVYTQNLVINSIANAAMENAGLNDRFAAIKAFPAVKGIKPVFGSYTNLGSNVLCLTDNCTEKEAALRLIDYLLSPEGQILNFYGIKGQTYDIVKGKPVLRTSAYQAFLKNQGECGATLGIRILDPGMCNNQKYNWEKEMQSPSVKADIKTASMYAYDGTQINRLLLSVSTPEGKAWSAIKSTLSIEVINLILAKSQSEFNSSYKAFMANLEKMGLSKVEALWTKQYNRNMLSAAK